MENPPDCKSGPDIRRGGSSPPPPTIRVFFAGHPHDRGAEAHLRQRLAPGGRRLVTYGAKQDLEKILRLWDR